MAKLLLLAAYFCWLVVVAANDQQQLCNSGTWLSHDAILATVQPGDMVAIRQNSESLPRVVSYVGNGRVVKEVLQNDVKKMALAPLVGMLDNDSAEACIVNLLDVKLFLNSSDITEAKDGMVERALSQVGKLVRPSENTTELHLAAFARYGQFNSTWLEKAMNGSSMALLGQINGVSLQAKNLLDGLFGEFTKKLTDKAMDSLTQSSIALGGQSLAKQSVGTSFATLLGGRK